MNSHNNLFNAVISLENLFASWNEFKPGKRHKKDVQSFEREIEDEIFALHDALKAKTYRHRDYTSFYITDPKLRHIHKAEVRDRIVHHAFYRVLYPIFDQSFIHDSYSCRFNKGTHRAVARLETFARKLGTNYTSQCYALKCDIKKFFDSVDHAVLIDIIKRKIKDPNVMALLTEIITSFGSVKSGQISLFADVYERERERESRRPTAAVFQLVI